VMILDNARIHHAKLLKPLLEANKERLQLVFLPPYSPKLNLIEGLWGWLKEEVICNVFFPVVEAIRKAVQGFLSSINKVPMQVIDILCLRM
jgi:transposase